MTVERNDCKLFKCIRSILAFLLKLRRREVSYPSTHAASPTPRPLHQEIVEEHISKTSRLHNINSMPHSHSAHRSLDSCHSRHPNSLITLSACSLQPHLQFQVHPRRATVDDTFPHHMPAIIGHNLLDVLARRCSQGYSMQNLHLRDGDLTDFTVITGLRYVCAKCRSAAYCSLTGKP